MNYFNYKISGTKGKLYLSSKDPKEGYEKVTYGTDGEKITYHQYSNSTKGLFEGFQMKQVEAQGVTLSFLEVTLQDGDNQNKISVSLKDKRGNVSDEAKALISAFFNAEKGHEYTLTPNVKVNHFNGKEYKNLSVYVNSTTIMNDNGKGQSTGFIQFSEIPKPVKEDDGMGGHTYDNREMNKFFGGKLKEISDRFGSGNIPASPSNASLTAPVQNPDLTKLGSAITPKKDFEMPVSIEEDELPF